MRNEKGQFCKGNKLLVTHNMSQTRQYNTWNHMMSRCYREKDCSYKYYGNRGISVVKKWHTFIGFWEDMGNSYSNELSLERVDVDKNYCKANCKWIPTNDQPKNKTTTIYVNYNGKKRRLKGVCDKLGIPYMRVYLRIFRYKWSVEKAINKKV